VNIVWFKRDLRIIDHPALTAAQLVGPVVAIYIFEPELWTQPDMSYRHFLFLKESLTELQTALAQHGIDILIFNTDAISALKELHLSVGITHLWASQETWNGWTYTRDQLVREWLQHQGIGFTEIPQHGVVRRLKNRDGWANQWRQQMSSPMVSISPVGSPITPTATLRIPQHLTPDGIVHRQHGGTNAALNCLTQFLTNTGQPYTKAMSSPVTAFTACSRLSAHLAFGTISLRHVYQAAIQRQQQISAMAPGNQKKEWASALKSFLGRLRWHCHFMQKLEDDPTMEYQALHPLMRDLDTPPLNRRFFNHWVNGTTGFPMVDACMRALTATGWLNFRMRAMVMSVACHHLQLPWRPCALHLATQFVDYEPGIHYSQCQMQAGRTGINAIRIYNPIKQGMDHDPTGQFIRQWVPEYSNVPQSGIHMPWLYGHTPPIVDEKIARTFAASQLYSRKKSPSFQTISKNILKKHGSRRTPNKSKKTH
jgi:deoxyribodipyrimidine photo-lyase